MDKAHTRMMEDHYRYLGERVGLKDPSALEAYQGIVSAAERGLEGSKRHLSFVHQGAAAVRKKETTRPQDLTALERHLYDHSFHVGERVAAQEFTPTGRNPSLTAAEPVERFYKDKMDLRAYFAGFAKNKTKLCGIVRDTVWVEGFIKPLEQQINASAEPVKELRALLSDVSTGPKSLAMTMLKSTKTPQRLRDAAFLM
jgi:hypothetical protein